MINSTKKLEYYPAPVPSAELLARLPAVVKLVYYDNEAEELNIYIEKTDKNVTSFTVHWCAAAAPGDKEDRKNSYVCRTTGDSYYLIRLDVSKVRKYEAFTAYVSDAVLTTGKTEVYPVSSYKFPESGDDDVTMKVIHRMREKANIGGSLKRVFGVFFGIIAFAAVVAVFTAGTYYFTRYSSFNETLKCVKLLDSAGLYREAEDLAGESLKDNFLYDSYLKEVRETAETLISEERYNEAYSIISQTPCATLLQTICEKASEYEFARNDIDRAYSYAMAAPEPFTEKIIAKVGELAEKDDTGEPDFKLIGMLSGDGDVSLYDEAYRWYLDRELEAGHVASAVKCAGMLSDKNEAEAIIADIYKNDIKASLDSGEFELAEAKRREYEGYINDDAFITGVKCAVYEYYLTQKNYPAMAYYSELYGVEFVMPEVTRESSEIRSCLDVLYFRMNADEMRLYHSNSVAASNVVRYVKNGSLTVFSHGANKTYKNISCIDASDFYTSVVYTDGRADIIPNRISNNPSVGESANDKALAAAAKKVENAVQTAAGDGHIVFLLSDGTVEAYGDNTAGQCEVTGWSGIVAVAAGSDFTAGLKSDGTLVACGSDRSGQCRVEGYNNVVDIRACSQSLVILFRDGTLGLAGERSCGLDTVLSWSGIVRIRAGKCRVIAEADEALIGEDEERYLCAGVGDGVVGGLENAYDFAAGNTFAACIGISGKTYTNGKPAPAGS